MPTPILVRAKLEEILQRFTKILEITRLFAEVTAVDNFVNRQGLYIDNHEGKTASRQLEGIEEIRAGLDTMLASGQITFDAILQEWARFLGIDSDDEQVILDEMYLDFLAFPSSVQSRVFVRGAVVPDAGNIGDGELLRLTVDANSLDMENSTAELKRATCLSDQSSGAKRNREIFFFEGATASEDQLETLGSAVKVTVEASAPVTGLLLNPSFDGRTPNDTTPTDITNWVSSVPIIGDGTDYAFDPVNVYLPAPDDQTTVRSLIIKQTRVLTQKILDRGTVLNPGSAFFLQVAFERSTGGATGTLTLRMGSQFIAVAVAAQVGWQRLRLVLDANSWFENFNVNDLSIQVDWLRTAGELRVDDVIFVPVTFIDGIGHVLIPGQTPFQAPTAALPTGDRFTWTDTETGAIIQRWVARRYGRYLPHSGAPTIPDP